MTGGLSLTAGFRRVVSLEVRNDLGDSVRWDGLAKGAHHFIDLCFPSGGWKRWLHRNVNRAVAGAAVRLDQFAIFTWSERCSGKWVEGDAVHGTCVLSGRGVLIHVAGSGATVIAALRLRAEGRSSEERKGESSGK